MSDLHFTEARWPEPGWFPYATEIVRRLHLTLAAKDGIYGRDTLLVSPEDEPDASAGDLAEAEAEPYEIGAFEPPSSKVGGRDQEPQEERPLHPLSPGQLQLALRLAATFGTREGLLRCLEPGALTLLGGMTPGEAKPLTELLWLGLLPRGCRIRTKPGQRAGKADDLLMIRPDAGDDGISRYALRGFHEQIGDALRSPAPVLILCPDEAMPPAGLARYLPGPLRLAPIDRRLMLQHFRLAYPDAAVDPSTLLAALPEDRHLAGLSPLGLHVALRAPDALAAAGRLAGFLQPPAGRAGSRLEDIAGDGEALTAARQLVRDLGLWRQKTLAWSDLCRSLLLHGRPGTGKTWLARAMGNSADVGFVATSFAEWQSTGHLGDMLKAMRKSFAEARSQAPAILFIDEIDAVGSREDGDRHNSNYRHQVINGFLEQMDSISREEGVIVVGACNHPDRIDPAVLRAGRFDLKIEVPMPDAAAILGILRHHLGEAFDAADLRGLARAAVGSSAAEVDAAIRMARATARGDGRDLRPADVHRHLGASDRAGDAWDRRAAVHECGHAIAAAVLGTGEVIRVMLTREGGTTSRRLVDHTNLIGDLEAELAYAMAGRAAERLVFGDVCAGSGGPEQSDLARATKLAVAIDTLFGLGVYGPLWIDVPPEVVLRDPEARARIRARLEAAEELATAILAAHREHLTAMADALVRERELTGDALADWLAPVKGHRQDRGGIGSERLAG